MRRLSPLPAMPPLPPSGRAAVRAARIAPLAENAARGRALSAPVSFLENHWLVLRQGRIADICPSAPPGHARIDLGNVILLPPLCNAHTHLSLSFLAGKTLWGHGFAPWLKSMLPHLFEAINSGFGAQQHIAPLRNACQGLEQTLHVGDIGGSLANALRLTQSVGAHCGLAISHFCEWFGYADSKGPWPPRARKDLAIDPDLEARCAPAGHALYSTAPAILQKAHAWCCKHGRVFSMHLAESAEETELLLSGSGPLYDLYAGSILPPGWQPPRMRPIALAKELGLLTANTLAVHCAQLENGETDILAASGAAVCLCPRSNYNLAAGCAPVLELARAGALLCLGTDGLTSNTDLDVRAEALWLRQHLGLPWPALWRMATVNGCAALGMPYQGLAPGAPARFSIWPEEDDV